MKRTFYILLIALTFISISTTSYAKLTRHEYDVLVRVQNYLNNDQSSESLELLIPLLKKDHPSSYAISYGAISYANIGEQDKACSLWERGAKLYPTNRNILYNCAISQMQSERFKKAVENFEKVYKIDSKADKVDPEILYQLSFALYQLQNYVVAEKYVAKLVLFNPCKPRWVQLQLYIYMSQQKWNKAIKSGKKLVQLAPQKSYHWELLGSLYINTKEYAKAVSALEISNNLNKSKRVKLTLIQLYKALSVTTEIERLEKTVEPVSYEHADHLYHLRKFDESLDILNKLIATGSNSLKVNMLKARNFVCLKKYKEALKAFDTCLSCDLDKKWCKNKSLKQKRRRKDQLKAQVLFLAGQLCWLNGDFLTARDYFKKLALISGNRGLGNNLASCMQQALDARDERIELPNPLDDPLPI